MLNQHLKDRKEDSYFKDLPDNTLVFDGSAREEQVGQSEFTLHIVRA